MPEIKFIIHTETLRKPKFLLKIIHDFIIKICGTCYIEQPEGYLTKEDLK